MVDVRARRVVSRSMSDTPHVLHFRVSHYNEKVRWALDFKAWPHTRKAYVPGLHIVPMRLRTGQTQVPVMILGDETLIGSSHILAEIERRRPAPPLYPTDPEARARALAIEKYFDDEVAPDLRRLFWASYFDDRDALARMATDGASSITAALWKRLFPLVRGAFGRKLGLDAERIAAARSRLVGYFDRLEAELGERQYLVGDRFGVADLAAAAVMSGIVRPPQFSYPLPEPWPAPFVELRESFAHRAGFQWVLDIYARHRGSSSEIRSTG